MTHGHESNRIMGRRTTLISKADADGPGRAHQLSVGIDRLQMADGVGYVDGNDGLATQGDHHAETSGGDQVDRSHTKARGQYPVEGRRRASTLDMPQHAHPDFFFRAQGNGIADQVANGAQASPIFFQLGWMLNPFRHHHDGDTLAAFFALRDVFADVADGEGNFGNENDVRPTAYAGLERDPPAVASHDLDYHDAWMRRTGRVNLS